MRDVLPHDRDYILYNRGGYGAGIPLPKPACSRQICPVPAQTPIKVPRTHPPIRRGDRVQIAILRIN